MSPSVKELDGVRIEASEPIKALPSLCLSLDVIDARKFYLVPRTVWATFDKCFVCKDYIVLVCRYGGEEDRVVHQMQWYRAQAKKPPHYHLLPRHILEISYARYSDIEPFPPRVSDINFFSCRRRDDLHAVIATAEEHSAYSIDTQMKPGVDPCGFVARTREDLRHSSLQLERT